MNREKEQERIAKLLRKTYDGYAFETVFASKEFKEFGLEDVTEELLESGEKYENGEYDDDFPREDAPVDDINNIDEEASLDQTLEEPIEPEDNLPEPEEASLNEDEATAEENVTGAEETGEGVENPEEGSSEPETEYQPLDVSFFENPGEWDEASIDELKSDAECINMVKIIATFNNSYVENMESIYKKNPNKVELTGDISKSELFKFISDGVKTIELVYQNDKEAVREITDLFRLVKDIPKMKAICGNEKTPFIYEGIQLLILELVRVYLALIPFHLRENKTLTELIVDMKLNVVKTLREIANDIVEVSNLFGTRIYFIPPIESDTTGKSEELANTEYAMLPELQRQGDGMNYSGESIMNLIQIKNQNALPEYALISKMLQIVSSLSRDIDLEKTCLDLVNGIKDLLLSQRSEDKVNQYADLFREIVIIPQIDAFQRMVSEEQKKLTIQ